MGERMNEVGGVRKRRGASLVEIGALIGLVAVVAIGSVSTVGTKVSEIFGGTANAISQGMDGQLSGSVNLAGGVSASNHPPVLATPNGVIGSVRPGAVAGSAVGILAGSDPDGDALSFSGSGLPSWLSVGSNGHVVVAAGQTPPNSSSSQSFAFVGIASDGQVSATGSFSVLLTNSAPVITSASSQSISAGSAPTNPNASDGDGDAISWSMTGSIPGLSLSDSGVWSGSAMTGGSFPVTLQVSDGKGGDSSQSFALTVSDPCPGYKVAGQNKCIFTYLGSNQTFVVPTGVSSLSVKLWGAGGGGSGGYWGIDPNAGSGGGGGHASGTLAVTPGESLTVLVGVGGRSYSVDPGSGAQVAPVTFGGGGSANYNGGMNGSSGGGRSAIRRSSTELATAGGGGGASSFPAGSGSAGGGGGGAAGQAGALGNGGSGAGGTQSAGGSGVGDGQSGSAFQGGSGAANGAGGGGWFGGGGSTQSIGPSGGGGGGSGYVGGLTGAVSLGASGSGAAGSGVTDYAAGAAVGGACVQWGLLATKGGNGRVVVSW